MSAPDFEEPPAHGFRRVDFDPGDQPRERRARGDVEERADQGREQGALLRGGAKGEVHTFGDEIDALTRGEAETLSNEAKELSKFFGIYKQQERGERGKKTDDYFFMVRIKVPGGRRASARSSGLRSTTPPSSFADGTLRITSRQGIQYHHVYGPKLAPLIRFLNRNYRDQATLAACGDVNRNVMCSPIDGLEPGAPTRARRAGLRDRRGARAAHAAPTSRCSCRTTRARTVAPMNCDEPLYGEQYLPRKFKVGIAHPDDNSVDVLTQDVAFVPVRERGRPDGSLWDFYSGGGLGMTHNKPQTAPLLGAATSAASAREQVVDAARAIAILQKENGERKDRRQARWKYTIRRLGVDAVQRGAAVALPARARGRVAGGASADAASPRLARPARTAGAGTASPSRTGA